MKAVRISLLLAAVCGLSFGYTFWMAITFEDEPTSWASCTLGVQPGATDGFDFGVDAIAIPSFLTFGAAFAATDGGMLNLAKDIRSDTDSLIIWKAQFSNYTAPDIKARWMPTWAPFDSMCQIYAGYGMSEDAVAEWFPMNAVDTLVIPVGYFAFFKMIQEVEPGDIDTIPPVIANWFPADGDTVSPDISLIYFEATDSSGIDTSMFSVHFWIDTVDYGFITTKVPIVDGVRVQFTPFLPFTAGATVRAIAQVQDRATPANIASDTIEFYISGGTGPSDSSLTLTVQTMLTGFPPPTSLALTKVEIVELAISQMTDDMGQTIFDSLPSATYSIVASREDYFNAGTVITMTRDTMIYLVLMEDTTGGGGGNSVSGTVTLDGAAVHAGSILSMTSILGDSSVLYDTTDAAGAYAFTGLTPGMYKIVASHVGYEPDSAFPMVFFGDTTINFTLFHGGPVDYDLLVIDWDNGDVLMPWGIGPAEAFYSMVSGRVDAGITAQDPNIASLDLSGVRAIAFFTGNRLGTNAIADDASIGALTDFVGAGGSVYWEGLDNACDYSTGSLAAREFFGLFGVDYGADGFSASTGNIEKLVLYRDFESIDEGDTISYAFRSEADHFADELIVTSGGDAIAISHLGPSPTVSPIRAAFKNIGTSVRIISSFYSCAAESTLARDGYIDNILYYLLEWTDIPEVERPVSEGLISVEPNPFNAACRISAPMPVELYDLSGRLVCKHPGDGSFWRAVDRSGDELPSGIYLAVMRAPSGEVVGGRGISLVR